MKGPKGRRSRGSKHCLCAVRGENGRRVVPCPLLRPIRTNAPTAPHTHNCDRMDVDDDLNDGRASKRRSTGRAEVATANSSTAPLPAFARAWNLPGLQQATFPPSDDLDDRIAQESLFFLPGADETAPSKFIVPFPCQFCLRKRKKFCDRRLPACSACTQFDMTCTPTNPGWMELPPKQGPGSRSGGRAAGNSSTANAEAKDKRKTRPATPILVQPARPSQAKATRKKRSRPTANEETALLLDVQTPSSTPSTQLLTRLGSHLQDSSGSGASG